MNEFIAKNNLIAISPPRIPANGSGDMIQMCYDWKTKRYLEVSMEKQLSCMRSCEDFKCNCPEFKDPIIYRVFSLKKGLEDYYWGADIKEFHFNNDLFK